MKKETKQTKNKKSNTKPLKPETKVETSIQTNEKQELKIWNDIKDLTINVFAFEKTIADAATPISEPQENKLIVSLKISASLPAIEAAVATKGYEVELAHPYVEIKKKNNYVF